MKDLNLELEKKIDFENVKFQALQEFKKKKLDFKSLEQSIIYVLIHKFSNYERVMWQLYKQDKNLILFQLKNLLLEISKLDHKLTWDCQIVFNRYKNQINLKRTKSQYVV